MRLATQVKTVVYESPDGETFMSIGTDMTLMCAAVMIHVAEGIMDYFDAAEMQDLIRKEF